MKAPLLVVAVRHGWRLWRAGQIRFRLETFGVYYPSAPYEREWWRVSPRYAIMLLRRLVPYLHWVAEMERLQSHDRIRERRRKRRKSFPA